MQTREILKISKIIPVITIYDVKTSINLAHALIAGGVRILEITLRTKDALEAIKIISSEVPEAIVGAGTVLNIAQLESAKNAGAKFAISPGLNYKFLSDIANASGKIISSVKTSNAKASISQTKDIIHKAKNIDLPFIPGIATAGELMLALEFGYENVKFFPAEFAGGVGFLKSLVAPFSNVKFCPTGAVSLKNIKEYLALENVPCVGGSWLTPKDLVLNKKWEEITKITRESLEFLQTS